LKAPFVFTQCQLDTLPSVNQKGLTMNVHKL